MYLYKGFFVRSKGPFLKRKIFESLSKLWRNRKKQEIFFNTRAHVKTFKSLLSIFLYSLFIHLSRYGNVKTI